MARRAKTVDPATQVANDARLDEWERRSRPAIIAAALIPLIGVSTGTNNLGFLGNAVEIACWLVFLVDLVVHMRLRPGYLHTGIGRFDLAVVVLTSPWYLLPGMDGGEFVTLLRLARLARVAVVGVKTPVIKRTLDRLGRPFLYVTIILCICAAIVMRAEHQKHGFKTYGDALWWGVVTITTVGYGDIVPESRVGRVTAAFLMITGVALLGTVAASLASMFRLEDRADEEADGEATEERPEAAPVVDAPGADVVVELRALREEIAALRAEIAGRNPDPP